MYKNILVLDDGTEVSAGTVGQNAIVSMTWTENVSKTTDLAPGAACANKIEAVIWVEPGNDLLITSGTRLRYYRETPAGQRTLAGTFWAVKPTRQTRNTYKVFAYDVVSKLDSIQSSWLMDNQSMFPLTIWQFAQKVAARCGVAITNAALPRNGGYQVQAFYADDLTGRQLLAWVAEASGTYLRATADGQLAFDWYSTGDDGVGPSARSRDGIIVLAGDTLYTSKDEQYTLQLPTPYYYKGSLSYEDYETQPIDKVQIKSSDDDVGAVYPAEATGTNAWVISGNMLLSPTDADTLAAAAQALYPVLQDVSYRPCSFETPDDGSLQVGQIIQVTDARGRTWTTWLMSAEHSGGRVKFSSTGNARRDGTAAVNEQSYTNLTGKLLEISTSVDGLRVVNRDLQGSLASLELTVDGIETNVRKQLDDMTDYVDQETGQIKDQAVSEAVSSALSQVDSKLQFYPTESEMQSAIEQSASEINLSVSQTLRGYATTSQMQQYVNGQTSGILQDAQDYTDGQLQYYPTTIEMNSAINQSASSINLTVSEKLTMYSTTSQMQNYVNGQTSGILSDAQNYTDQQVQSRPTTTTVQNMIDVGIEGITLSATTNGNTSTITLRHDGAQISSANITFTGFVTFSDLSGSGKSTINGDNITTGVIRSGSGNTEYNLDNGYIRSGPSSGTRFEINSNRINWYVDNYLTGVLYSVYGTSYLGANSQYTIYGWVDSGTPSSWHGMQVDNNASQCLFNTNHVDVQHDLGVSGTVSTRDLSAWGSKNRIVHTPLGNLAFAAMESPEPAFCDWGGGTIGEDGVCPVYFSQQYAAGISLRQAARWLVTPLGGEGSFWVERTDWGALVHGQPGSRFDWLCIGVQFDMAGVYAPESDATPPVEKDEAVDLARYISMDSERNEQDLEKLMEGSR